MGKTRFKPYQIILVLITALLAGCEPAQTTILDRVLERGELQVLTRNSASTYYEGPDGPAGLEYELAEGFAHFLGVKLKLRIPGSLSLLLKEIRAGKGDIAAAGLTITNERKTTLLFGPSYQNIKSQLVYRTGTPKPKNLSDLHGSLEIVANSSHEEQLIQLQSEYPNLSFVRNTELPNERLLALVWEQVLDYTVADSNEIAVNRRFYPELRVAFNISPPEPIAWAFPPGEDRSLIGKVEEYFELIRASGELERLLERYYGHIANFDYVGTRRYMAHIEKRLPNYQQWFESAGNETNEDWRLLAAVGYQESHWNPKAISPTGVRGLMMLTQSTMKQLKMKGSRHDPETSIRGGARYIKRVKKRIPERIREPDRTWMALAAYNVGFGHLEDARILAQRDGADPDKWVDVIRYLPLLSEEQWYQQTRHGYARGHEPVAYVENIRSYYDILVWITDKNLVRRSKSPALGINSPAL